MAIDDLSNYYVNDSKRDVHGWGLARCACLTFNAMGLYKQLPTGSVVVDRRSIEVVSWSSTDQI